MKLVKIDKSPARPALEALTEKYRERRDLEARAQYLTAIILDLEAGNAVPVEPGAAAIARREARSIIRPSSGRDDFDGLSPGERLFEAHRERNQIWKKLESSIGQMVIAENDRAEEIRAHHRGRHARHVQRVADLLIALRDEHRAWERDKDEITEQEGMRVFWTVDPTENWFFQTDFDRQYPPVANFFDYAVSGGLLPKDPR